MRCSCQNCGEYMVQDEKGLDSRCICPVCLNTCSACMGTVQVPLDRDGLRAMLDQRRMADARIEPMEQPFDSVDEWD